MKSTALSTSVNPVWYLGYVWVVPAICLMSVSPGLILLGFKDQSAVKFKHNIKHAAFVTPDESVGIVLLGIHILYSSHKWPCVPQEFTGSSSVFAHLLDRLHARDKIAICRFVPRRNAAPRIVALLPEVRSCENAEWVGRNWPIMQRVALQKGQIDKDGDEVPYGFHVIYMPFADDIRHIPSSIASSGKSASYWAASLYVMLIAAYTNSTTRAPRSCERSCP